MNRDAGDLRECFFDMSPLPQSVAEAIKIASGHSHTVERINKASHEFSLYANYTIARRRFALRETVCCV
jgi:hypothetical protein